MTLEPGALLGPYRIVSPLGAGEFSPGGSTVLFTRSSGVRPSTFRVPLVGGDPRRRVDDAAEATWSPDGQRIAFLRSHAAAPGKTVFVQDFVPGRDTRATRRKLGGFDPEVDAETFGVSPDGSRVVIAGREMVSSLVLLDGVAGLGPSK